MRLLRRECIAGDWRKLVENYLEHYQGKTVLVTGGAGAIGSNLSRRLAELGAQVIILDDLSSAERWNIP